MMPPKLDWRAPAVVYKEAERERLAMTGSSYLGNLGRPRREKFIAALFGLGYEQHVGPCRLAALSDAPGSPDVHFFVLSGHGRQHAFQTVEVLDPARRRGDASLMETGVEFRAADIPNHPAFAGAPPPPPCQNRSYAASSPRAPRLRPGEVVRDPRRSGWLNCKWRRGDWLRSLR
jgi:hypothetical protein